MFKQSENNVSHDPRLVAAAGKGRGVLPWVVVVVVISWGGEGEIPATFEWLQLH